DVELVDVVGGPDHERRAPQQPPQERCAKLGTERVDVDDVEATTPEQPRETGERTRISSAPGFEVDRTDAGRLEHRHHRSRLVRLSLKAGQPRLVPLPIEPREQG